MKLSKNLTLAEAIYSNTAKREGISNYPTPEHIEALKVTAEAIFQPCREHFNHPLYVSSGYRSDALNKALKGSSKTSQHMKGEAFDLDADKYGGFTNKDLFEFIKENLVFDQLIAEFVDKGQPRWIHVSYKPQGNRRQILIALKDSAGKTKYHPYSDNLYKETYP